MTEHICKPSCHNPCLLDKHNPYTAPVAPSRSAAPEPTIDEAVKLIKKIEACEGIGAKLTLLRNFVGKQASAAPPSANCVYEIRPDNPPPSCHVCGAVMVATRFNCRSCGATTEPTGAAPPSEREAAFGSDLPAFRAELEKQWMSQDVILDFRNWLVVALWNAQAAAVPAPRTREFKFPTHKCGLYLTHNEHRDMYEKLPEWIADLKLEDAFQTPEAMKRAIETDDLWVLQWYPDTPVGFYRVAAPTLEELFDALAGATAPPKEEK